MMIKKWKHVLKTVHIFNTNNLVENDTEYLTHETTLNYYKIN